MLAKHTIAFFFWLYKRPDGVVERSCTGRKVSYTECSHGLEMKSRKRATAPVRSTSQRHVNHLKDEGEIERRQNNRKCWLCKNPTHWPDQCPKFAALGIDERLKMAKENHVRFSCVRRPGRDHRAANCTQRQQCTIAKNGA